jgi:hypothetical protein
VIQQTDVLGGGVSGGKAQPDRNGTAAGKNGETAASSGISTAWAASFGCVEMMKPGSGDSPQPQLSTGMTSLFSRVTFFWQQLATAVAARFWQQQREAF